MRAFSIFLGLLVLLGLPVADAADSGARSGPALALPPADARHFVIQSSAGKHGDSWYWEDREGHRGGRESMNLRGQVWEVDMQGTQGADGIPTSLVIHGVSPQGDASESFAIEHGTARWRSPIDQGQAEYVGKAFYVSQGGPIASTIWLLERLLASPDRRLGALPGGLLSAEELDTLEVGGGSVPKQTVHLWSVSGLNAAPVPVWADKAGHFFALTAVLGWLPEAYAGEQQRLEAAQAGAMARQTGEIAHRFLAGEAPPLAFIDVQIFDAEGLRFTPHQTVVVEKGRISAVGPVANVTVPGTARRIAGRGMTLLPGLWDCHMHVADDYTGVQELSLGVTSVRDPGNNDA